MLSHMPKSFAERLRVMVMDYAGGPKVITRGPIRGRKNTHIVKERDTMMETEWKERKRFEMLPRRL